MSGRGRFPAAILAAAAACATPAAASPEGRWVLAAQRQDPAIAPRLEFTAQGRVAGFTGCNTLSGSYRVEGDRLEIVAATTKRACSGPGGDVERQLLEVLGGRPRWSLEGERLVLTGSQGSSLEMVPAP